MSRRRSMDQQWYIQTMEYCPRPRSSELLSHRSVQRKFRCIFLSERSPSEKAGNLGKANYRDTKRSSVATGLGEFRGRTTAHV